MKILALSDEECPALWDYYTPGKLAQYDLILSCGDLRADYLSFLVTMARAPLLYVHGNHDTHYATSPPEGCDCIDGRLVSYNGVRILGLGGCMWYHPGAHQYTEKQMRQRIARLKPALHRAGGVDIVVTHAPPRGIGDQDDLAHRGFESLLELMDKYHPQYLLHGHTHLCYGWNLSRVHSYGSTQVLNAYERCTLQLPEREVLPRQKGKLVWKNRRPRSHV